MPKIAIDAMGGDRAPEVVIDGALLAVRELGIDVVLVGQKDVVEPALRQHVDSPQLEIIHASQVVAMHESPSAALRRKDSSMKVCFEMMKRGEVDAVVSAGNSGAMMATGMFVMGTLSQVLRPAILIIVPTQNKGTVIIDGGANVDCKPRHLIQFALMGSIYAERVLGIEKPRIGVLSNGEEDGKGTELTRATNEMLGASPLNHIGYVEGRDIFNSKCDVIVCDGFTGNVVLKTMEGAARFAGDLLKEAFQRNLASKMGYLMSRNSLRAAYRRLDYAEYGGAPLIGLDGVSIIAHGGSNALAIRNALRAAHDAVEQEVNRHVAEALSEIDKVAGLQSEGLPRKIWQKFKSKIDALGEKSPAQEVTKQESTKEDSESDRKQ